VARRPLLLLLLALAAAAGDVARPRHNGSYVRDDVAALAALVAEARAAAEAGDFATASERIEALLETEERGLIPVREPLLYLAPRRWAQLQLVSGPPPFGTELLKAWRDAHDAAANALISGAILSGDEDAARALVGRYPAATAAPGALLALSDRALQRGDPDEAAGLLLRVAEHVPLAEQALLDAEPYRRRADYLRALPPRPPAGWPTAGGDTTRARAGDPLPPPERLKLLWESPFLGMPPPSLENRLLDRTRETSPLVPFQPVCDAEHVYVHLGPAVAAFRRKGGKLAFYAPEGTQDGAELEQEVDDLYARNPATRAATVADGVLYFDRARFDRGAVARNSNELIAFDVARRSTLWKVELRGEGTKSAHLPIHFSSAPAVVGDRLYVAGAVRDQGDDRPTAKEEAHLFCLDRATGDVLWRRFLGYGDTDAPPDFPPLSGLPPAVGRGVVVAVTGLGVAAACDARTGEPLWLFRYDRRPARERERLLEQEREQLVHLRSGWMREPPRIAGDSVYFAPFDAEEMFACWLRGAKAPGHGFEVEQWATDRAKGHRHSLFEYVGGLLGGRILYVGRRDARPALSVTYRAVVSQPLDRAVGFAYGLLPHGVRDDDTGEPVPPEVYGYPALAGDVLLVPTRRAVYRFDAGREPSSTLDNGERMKEIAVLPPYLAPETIDEEEAAFGSLVAVDGFLFAATTHRLYCYGAAP
jgi:hypothetical protein